MRRGQLRASLTCAEAKLLHAAENEDPLAVPQRVWLRSVTIPTRDRELSVVSRMAGAIGALTLHVLDVTRCARPPRGAMSGCGGAGKLAKTCLRACRWFDLCWIERFVVSRKTLGVSPGLLADGTWSTFRETRDWCSAAARGDFWPRCMGDGRGADARLTCAAGARLINAADPRLTDVADILVSPMLQTSVSTMSDNVGRESTVCRDACFAWRSAIHQVLAGRGEP